MLLISYIFDHFINIIHATYAYIQVYTYILGIHMGPVNTSMAGVGKQKSLNQI